jgi:glycogen debranching enzyme
MMLIVVSSSLLLVKQKINFLNFNKGTWQDKLGSSEKAGNKGVPSTPRDGSAIELVGLQAGVLRFLEKCSEYPYKSVERKNTNETTTTWTFKEWAEKIEQNFEKYFYVDENDTSSLVHRKKIYKDTVRNIILTKCLRYSFKFKYSMAPAENSLTINYDQISPLLWSLRHNFSIQIMLGRHWKWQRSIFSGPSV